MAKSKDILKWLKEMLGLEKPETARPKSIIERLEGLIIPVDLIQKSYKVDREVADAGHQILLATEKLIKASLKKQQDAIQASELLLDQQGATSDIIDTQVYRVADVKTLVWNFKIFLTEDEATITWILEHIIEPALFGASFANLEPGWQRKLFNSLRTTVNSLQKEHGMLVEPRPEPVEGPRQDAPARPKGQTATG